MRENITKLYFIRHGSVNYNENSKDINISLSSKGKSEAINIREKWELPVDLIYTSPLPRAVETITPLASKLNINPIIIQELRELNYMGNTYSFHEKLQEDKDFKHPGGESLPEANIRFREKIIKIADTHPLKKIILSTHGTVLSQFFINEFGFDKDFFFKLKNPDFFEVHWDNKLNKFIFISQLGGLNLKNEQ